MDMPTPNIYKKMAVRLHSKKSQLWRYFWLGVALCIASILYAYAPPGGIKIDPQLRLALIVISSALGAEMTLISFSLICIRYWFADPNSIEDTGKSKSCNKTSGQ